MKTFGKIILGLIILALIIKYLPIGLAIAFIVLLYKKNWMGKKSRLAISIFVILLGSFVNLLMAMPTPEETAITTTATPQIETKVDKIPAAAPIEEKTAEEEAPKQEAPKAPINIITTLNEADAIQHIKDNAKADWATDFEEQRFVIGEQTKAYNDLKALVIDTPEKELILNQAHSDWGYDFEETLFIYNEQLKAYNELNK